MRFPAFLDTNVLYPISLADTVLRFGEVEIIRPKWSADVMLELRSNLAARVGQERADRRVMHMQAAFPEAMVSGYEALVDAMENERKDRHILAAAVESECEVIVTFNLRDFPSSALAPHDIVAVSPDDFLLDQLDLYPQLVRQALHRQAAETARPSLTFIELIERLERTGLRGFAAELRRRWPDLAG